MSQKEKTDERWHSFLFWGLSTAGILVFPAKEESLFPRQWQLRRDKEDLLLCVKLHIVYYWKQEYAWVETVISSSKSKGLSDPWTLNWNLLKLFCMPSFPHCDCSFIPKMAIIKLLAVKQFLLLKVKNVSGEPCDVHSSRHSHNALHCSAMAHPSPFNASHATYPWNSTAVQQPTATPTAAVWGEKHVWLQIRK